MKQNSSSLAGLRRLLYDHYALLSILVGSALFTFVSGPYYNSDSSLEFQAATSVIKTGMPYMQTGYLINQPPLGFYLDSIYFRIVGLTFNKGADFITFFGLGCVLLVYMIGKAWYGKVAGLFAAAIFALTPWQLIFSRTFLIDAQCLFFSLLSLLISVYAIKHDSVKVFMVSAIVFTLAFATKLYAVFTFVPIVLFYFRYRKRCLKRPGVVFAFFVPLVIYISTWYQLISRGSVLNLFSHDDFAYFNPSGALPSPFFVAIFLWTTLGGFLLVATVLSVIVSMGERQIFKNSLPLDLICLATVVVVAGVDTFMGVVLNYQVPFTAAVKYNYQLVPFVCLLGASLLTKTRTLFGAVEKKLALARTFFIVSALGLFLFFAAFFEGFLGVSLYSHSGYFVFWSQRFVAGYSFRSATPLAPASFLTYVQYFGFAVLLSGLILAALENTQLKLAIKKGGNRLVHLFS